MTKLRQFFVCSWHSCNSISTYYWSWEDFWPSLWTCSWDCKKAQEAKAGFEMSIARFIYFFASPPKKKSTAQGKCISFPNERDSSIFQANLKHVLNWFWYSFLLNSLSRIMAFRLMSPLQNSFLRCDAGFVLRAHKSSNYIIHIFTELCYPQIYMY